MTSLSVTAASPAGAGSIEPVAHWVTGDREVSVFQENGKLKYSIINGPDIETGNISLSLYDTPKCKSIALKFITIFQRVLLGRNSREHCFLPISWTIHERPSPEHNLLIALFARVRLAGGGNKEVVEAQWGVYELGSEAGTVSWLEAGDRHTHAFLAGAPAYRDKMEIYSQHFKEVVTLGPDNRVQSIVMRCVSGLNRDLFLDENTCAITLISVQKGHGIGGFFKLGHGSIAWEGIEAGSYFLRCADLTTVYPGHQKGQARIRIMHREIPSTSWLVGPTCSRTKELTDRMVAHISRDIVVNDESSWSSFIRFGFLAPMRNLFKRASELERERRDLTSRENCLSFAIAALQRAEIFLPEPGRAIRYIEPNAYVVNLRTDWVATEEDVRVVYRCIGAPQTYGETEVRILAHLFANIEDVLHGMRALIPEGGPSAQLHEEVVASVGGGGGSGAAGVGLVDAGAVPAGAGVQSLQADSVGIHGSK